MGDFLREHVTKRFARSPLWPYVRKEFIIAFPYCANCGKKGNRVHHIKPFHLYPWLELLWSNLITLCDNPRCHLDKGHLGNWRSYNPNVVEDCKTWNQKYLNRP